MTTPPPTRIALLTVLTISLALSGCTTMEASPMASDIPYWASTLLSYDRTQFVPQGMTETPAGRLVQIDVLRTLTNESGTGSHFGTALVNITTGDLSYWISTCLAIPPEGKDARCATEQGIFVMRFQPGVPWPFAQLSDAGESNVQNDDNQVPTLDVLRAQGASGNIFAHVKEYHDLDDRGMPGKIVFHGGETWMRMSAAPHDAAPAQVSCLLSGPPVQPLVEAPRPISLDPPDYTEFPAEHAIAALDDLKPVTTDLPITSTQLQKTRIVYRESSNPVTGESTEVLSASAKWSIVVQGDSGPMRALLTLDYGPDSLREVQDHEATLEEWVPSDHEIPFAHNRTQSDFGAVLAAANERTGQKPDHYAMAVVPSSDPMATPATQAWMTYTPESDDHWGTLIFDIRTGETIYATVTPPNICSLTD